MTKPETSSHAALDLSRTVSQTAPWFAVLGRLTSRAALIDDVEDALFSFAAPGGTRSSLAARCGSLAAHCSSLIAHCGSLIVRFCDPQE